MANRNATANEVVCWDSHGDIKIVTQRLKEMFVEMGQKTRIENGQKPAERAVFRKQHGIGYGKFDNSGIIKEPYPAKMEQLALNYNHQIDQIWEYYLKHKYIFYSQEQRWKESAFWKRRLERTQQ